MTVSRREAIDQAAGRLAAAGIAQPRREARLLLAHALGLTAEALLADLAAPLDPAAYAVLVNRRARREPFAFITGSQEFWGLSLAVSPATLIPRADTETLVEAAIGLLAPADRPWRVLDLGTGTGALLLAILSERPAASGVGVDVSPEAARLAARNARALGLADRAAFLAGDWAAALTGRFDLVVSNPPYIERAAISGLMPEVAAHEPARALDGGEDGLDAYRRIVADLARLLAPGGAAVLELGMGQERAVRALAGGAGFSAEARADLAGVPRALVLRGGCAQLSCLKKPFGTEA